MSEQLVSIGLPVYNGERYLEQAVHSLLNQTHTNLDINISDNASTDRTMDICRGLAQRDSRIRVSGNPTNLGASENFRRVLESARGEYFMWAACDDSWHENFVASMLDEHGSSENVAVSFCATRCIDEEGRLVGVQRLPEALNPNSMSTLRLLVSAARVRYKYNYVVYGMYKTAVLRAVYPAIPQTLASDRLLALVLPLVGSIRYVDAEMYTRRVYARPYQERYRDDSGENEKTLGYFNRGLATLQLVRSVVQIDVISWARKPLISVSVFCHVVSLLSQRVSEKTSPLRSGLKRRIKKLIR